MPAPRSSAFLLTHHPSQEELSNLCEIISSHIEQGDEAYLYCIYQGIASIYSREMQALRQLGLKLSGCAYAAEKRRLPLDDSAVFCGLGMLADIILYSETLSVFPREATHLPRKKLLIRPHSPSPSSEDIFETFRVASGLAAMANFKICIAHPALSEFPELAINSDFQHFQEIIVELSVSTFTQDDCEKEFVVLEF